MSRNASRDTETNWMSRPAAATDLRRRTRNRQEPRTADLVELANVPVVRQRGDGHIGDVVGVDERLNDIANRQHDLARQDHFEQEALAEVLVDPA